MYDAQEFQVIGSGILDMLPGPGRYIYGLAWANRRSLIIHVHYAYVLQDEVNL
jgi:hypothetical protein